MYIEKYICDYCNKEITSLEGMRTVQRISLCVEKDGIPAEEGYIAPVMGQRHFCDKECLRGWLKDDF